jgi:ABC-type metal ion transport system substrate-binding protein
MSLDVVAFLGEGAARALDDGTGSVVAGTYALSNGLLKHKLREESTDKGVSGSIGINQEFPTGKEY